MHGVARRAAYSIFLKACWLWWGSTREESLERETRCSPHAACVRSGQALWVRSILLAVFVSAATPRSSPSAPGLAQSFATMLRLLLRQPLATLSAISLLRTFSWPQGTKKGAMKNILSSHGFLFAKDYRAVIPLGGKGHRNSRDAG